MVSVEGIRRGVQSLAGIQIARVRPDNVFERVAGLQPPYNMIIFGNSHYIICVGRGVLVFHCSILLKLSSRRTVSKRNGHNVLAGTVAAGNGTKWTETEWTNTSTKQKQEK